MIDGCQYHEERCTAQRWISQLSSLKMISQAVRRNGEFLKAIEQEELKTLEIKEWQHLSNIWIIIFIFQIIFTSNISFELQTLFFYVGRAILLSLFHRQRNWDL